MTVKSAGAAQASEGKGAPEGIAALAPEQADALRQVKKQADAASAAVAAVIQAWFVAHIHNSPVARDVAAVNHLTASLAHLEAAILAALRP